MQDANPPTGSGTISMSPVILSDPVTAKSYRRTASDRLFRSIVGGTILLAVLFIGLYLRWGTDRVIGETPWYIPMMHSFVGLAAFCVGFLALGRYRVLREPECYWIGTGFTLFGLLSVFFILTWPGLLTPDRGILAHLPNTSGWMAVLELGTLGMFWVVSVRSRWPGDEDLPGRHGTWSVAVWLTAVSGIAGLCVAFEHALPLLVGPGGRLSPLLLTMDGGFLLLFAVGAVLSTRRYMQCGNPLLGYVAICQVAVAFVIVTALIGAKRYDVWYYLSRMVLAGGFLAMLFGLLSEYIHLFQRERDKTEALVIVEERFHAVADNIAQLAWMADAGGRIVWFNRRWLEYTGMTQEETRNYDRNRVQHPEHSARVLEHWKHSIRTGEPWEGTYPLRRADGQYRWFLSRAVPIRDERGTIVRWFGTNTDITEQRALEQELREREEQLRTATMAAEVGVWSWVPGTDEVTVAANWRNLFGISADAEVTFETWREAVHPEDRERAVASLMTATEQHREFDTVYRVLLPDGSVRWIVDRGRATYDEAGRPVGMAGANVDITERMRVEEALRQSREDLNRAQAVAQTGSWWLDIRRDELLWSDEAYRIFGIPAGTPMTYEAFLAAIHPDDRDFVDAEWAQALSG